MFRPRYKNLWNEAQAEAQRERDRADAAHTELRRLRGVLADYAKAEVVPEIEAYLNANKDARKIILEPLAYEGIGAFCQTNMRYSNEEIQPSQHLAWRGVALVRHQ